MPCEHLRQLYDVCEKHGLTVSSSDVIRFTCKECEQVEVCPSMLTDEYEARLTEEVTADSSGSPDAE